MTTPAPAAKVKTPRHLLIRTACEIGRVERFHAICGHTGITRRDFSQDLFRRNSRGEPVQVVTCPACLSYIKRKGNNILDAQRKENHE